MNEEVEDLRHALRVAQFNAYHWEESAKEAYARLARWQMEDMACLGRVKGLVDVRRKTLRMEDLRRALGDIA